MKTKFEPDFDAADEAVDRLKRLTQRPEPERGDWNAYMATALVDLDRALMSPEERRLRSAAPVLLEACRAALRWMQCGTPEGRSNNMQFLEKAIVKAEGK